MAQRRFHYEQAFEHFLRANQIPYIAVDEARKTVLPGGSGDGSTALKSFDCVVSRDDAHLLVDVKGRMYGPTGTTRQGARTGGRRFESWVTEEDVRSLAFWQQRFGAGFEGVFVFLYCLRQQPPDALFETVFGYRERWYAVREIGLDVYRSLMRVRSKKWGTVDVPSAAYMEVSRPFFGPGRRRECPDLAAGCHEPVCCGA